MIKRLLVRNFLSLKEIEIGLRQRNVLVGPNMSGKSNVVECLRFLNAICLVGARQAILDRDGFHEVLWKGKSDNRILIKLTADISLDPELGSREYEYEISLLGSVTGAFVVERELLTVATEHGKATLVNLRSGTGDLLDVTGSAVVRTPIDQDKSALELNIPGWEATIFKTWVSLWHFYRLVPGLMRRYNDAREQYFLNPTGDNFSAWLLTLQTKHRPEFERLRQVAVNALPGLEDIFAPPTQLGTTFVSTREKHLNRPVSLWRMSDGELVFLALLSLIFAPAGLGSPVICIEEPENHLHPKLIETLIEMYNQRRAELGERAAQVLITTHSPYVIDRMALEDLIVLQRRDGATLCVSPSTKDHLKQLVASEELGLGDLWYSGALSEP